MSAIRSQLNPRADEFRANAERMKALGHGKPTEMSAADALAVAKAATPETAKVDEADPSGLKAGQKISVTPDDTGKVPVSGTLVGLTSDRISIIRSDERVGARLQGGCLFDAIDADRTEPREAVEPRTR